MRSQLPFTVVGVLADLNEISLLQIDFGAMEETLAGK
jgi:hypothetical protein